jgi:acyl carrier protein
MKQEPELVIEPEFFRAYAACMEGVSGVAVEVRRGWRHNELTRFRYDAVLLVGQPALTRTPPPRVEWEQQPWEAFGSVESLCTYLRSARPLALLVRAVPSARLWTERLKLERLEQAEETALVSSLKLEEATQEGAAAAGAVEPEQLWALEGEVPYRIQVSWAERGADNCSYDVKCAARSGLSEPIVWSLSTGEQQADELSRPWSSYGNEMLAQPREQYLAQRLRQQLRQQLPEYMVPSRFVWVEELPLTTNGKLNRAAQPVPDSSRPDLDGAYFLPSNDVEAELADIWQEVLGLERVGVYDNFFDLGGHSLLLVKLHSRLSQHFNTSLSIIDLFRLPSVSTLARAMIAERHGSNLHNVQVASQGVF